MNRKNYIHIILHFIEFVFVSLEILINMINVSNVQFLQKI